MSDAGNADGTVESAAGAAPGRTPERIAVDLIVRFGLVGGILYAAHSVVWPFLPLLAWSAVLAVALHPVYDWVKRHLGGRGWLAAVLVSVASLAVVFGPVAMLSSSLVVSLETFAAQIRGTDGGLGTLPAALANLPFVGDQLGTLWASANTDSTQFLQKYAHTMMVPGEWVLKAVEGLAGGMLVFALATIVAGFLLPMAPGAGEAVRKAAWHVGGTRGVRFVALASQTIRAVARGAIALSLLVALLFGVALILFGVPHAGILTLVVLVLCVAQIGSAPVLLPLVIWFWTGHGSGEAALFTACMACVLGIEHGVKPILMRGDAETPTAVILIGVLGGMVAYGLPGLFLGPMLLALVYEMFGFWMETAEGDGTGPDPT